MVGNELPEKYKNQLLWMKKKPKLRLVVQKIDFSKSEVPLESKTYEFVSLKSKMDFVFNLQDKYENLMIVKGSDGKGTEPTLVIIMDNE